MAPSLLLRFNPRAVLSYADNDGPDGQTNAIVFPLGGEHSNRNVDLHLAVTPARCISSDFSPRFQFSSEVSLPTPELSSLYFDNGLH